MEKKRICFTMILRHLDYLVKLGLTHEEARLLTHRSTNTPLSAEEQALIPQIKAKELELKELAKAKKIVE